jgi:hypothetical protein
MNWKDGAGRGRETSLSSFNAEKVANAKQDFVVHGGSDAAGLGILLAGMVNAEEMRAIEGKGNFGTVGELVGRSRSDQTILLQHVEVGVPGNFSKCEDGFRTQDREFELQIVATI